MFYIMIFFCSMVFQPRQAYPAEVLSTEELRQLQQRMKNASQLSVDFMQVKTNSLRPNKPAKSSGKAVFAKPSKVRWQLTKPASTLIFDGETLYELKESDQTATKYTAKGGRAQDTREVIDLVLNFETLLERYKLIESTKENGRIKLKLEPKVAGSLSEIEVGVDSASAAIQNVTLVFSNKNRTRFEFSNPDRRAVPAATFEVPKAYKVIQGV